MIFTVAEAAALARVPVTDDFAQACAAVDTAIKETLSRTFEYGSFTERPYVEGVTYGTVLYLAEWPIHGIDELRIDYNGRFGDDTIADANSLIWTPATHHPARWSGRVESRFGYFYAGSETVQITYRAGFYAAGDTAAGHTPTMPEDIRRVGMRCASVMFKQGGNETMRSESIGNYSYSRFESVCSPADMEILMRYARV